LYKVTEKYDRQQIKEVCLCHLNGSILNRSDYAQQKQSPPANDV